MAKKITLGKQKEKAQKVFNKFIRERDSDGITFDCIACGQTKTVNQMNAGHYFNVKNYDGLRYDEDNVHGECISCNCFNDSHLIGYGQRLQNKIGEIRYNALLDKAADYKKLGYKFTHHELDEIINKYGN